MEKKRRTNRTNGIGPSMGKAYIGSRCILLAFQAKKKEEEEMPDYQLMGNIHFVRYNLRLCHAFN